MKKILFYRFIVLMVAGFLASCSKDDADVKIYMPSASGVVKTTFDIADTIHFTATIAGADYPTTSLKSGSNVTVNFTVSADMVGTFNEAMGTDYVLMPSENYTLDASGIISTGANSTPLLNLIIKDGDTIEPFSTFLLPVTIDNVLGGSVSEAQRTTFYVLTRSPSLENLPAFDRAAWTIADKSTEEPAEGGGNGLAIAAIDDNWNSYWHSQWAGTEPPPPHYITIDMGTETMVHGMSIVDRNLKDWAHGQPKTVRIALSTDGLTFEDNGGIISLPMKTDPVQEEIRFFLNSFKSARYIKVTVWSTWGDTKSTNIAEIYAL